MARGASVRCLYCCLIYIPSDTYRQDKNRWSRTFCVINLFYNLLKRIRMPHDPSRLVDGKAETEEPFKIC